MRHTFCAHNETDTGLLYSLNRRENMTISFQHYNHEQLGLQARHRTRYGAVAWRPRKHVLFLPLCQPVPPITRMPVVSAAIFIITFRMSRRRREMYIGHVRLCVCLSVRHPMPTLLHGLGCN